MKQAPPCLSKSNCALPSLKASFSKSHIKNCLQLNFSPHCLEDTTSDLCRQQPPRTMYSTLYRVSSHTSEGKIFPMEKATLIRSEIITMGGHHTASILKIRLWLLTHLPIPHSREEATSEPLPGVQIQKAPTMEVSGGEGI